VSKTKECRTYICFKVCVPRSVTLAACNYPNTCRYWFCRTRVYREMAGLSFLSRSTCGAPISITIQRISCYKFTKPFQLKRTNLMLQKYRALSERTPPSPVSPSQPIRPWPCFLQ